MFCHESSSLLVVFEKKQHDRINTREETMGETRGRREKRLIACTMIEEAAAAAGEKMASICQWGGLSGNISDAFAGVPCLTPQGQHASPYRLPTILLLAFSLSAVSLWQNQKAVEQESCLAAFQAQNG